MTIAETPSVGYGQVFVLPNGKKIGISKKQREGIYIC